MLNTLRAGVDAAVPATVRPRRGAFVREGVALFGVMVVAFALRLYLLGSRPLWLDEAYSLGVAGRSIRDILAFLRVSDAHPLGYYALLSVWLRWAGAGLAEARLPSLLFGLAAVFLTWRIGRRLFSVPVGLVAAGIVALNPFQIIAANEIRMYPLLECTALASTWLVWRAAQSSGARWWAAYGVSAAAMAYTSYYAFLLIPAQALWAWWPKMPAGPEAAGSHSVGASRRQTLGNLSSAGVAFALCYLPWMPYVLELPNRPVPARQPPHLDYLLGLAASQTFGGYLFSAGNYHWTGVRLPVAGALLLLLPFVGLLGLGIAALGRVNAPARLLVLLSWGGPLLLVVCASFARGVIAAYPRHLVFLEPFAAMLLAGAIVEVWRRLSAIPLRPAVVPAAACLLLAAFGYPAVAQFNPATQYYHYDLAAGLVQSHYQRGDAVVYFPAGTQLAFRYYFAPPGPEVRVVADRHAWSRAAFQPAIQTAADAAAAGGAGRIWLVYSLPWPKGSLSDLVRALEERGYRAGPSWDFRDLWVTSFTRGRASTP